jgi:hypothetical protein
MKESALPHYDDDLQNKLKPHVEALRGLTKQTDEHYREVLALSTDAQLGLEELKARLVRLQAPGSSASEIMTIYACPDLTAGCVRSSMTVREALRQARARRRGGPATTTDEERLGRASDKVLAWFPADKPWSFEGKTWILEFTPAAPAPPKAQAHE